MWCLVLLLGTLAPCKSLGDLCQTASGGVYHVNPENSTFYQCNSNSSAQMEVKTFYEGENITLDATGDRSGYGCSFETTDVAKNITCCYIHEDREKHRGKRLCQHPVQPEECRQPKSGRYNVVEKNGPIGWCILTLVNARKSDAGVYDVKFPYQPKYNHKQEVKIQPISLSHAETSGVVIVVLGVIAVILTLLFFKKLMPCMQEREKKFRKEDSEILALLKTAKTHSIEVNESQDEDIMQIIESSNLPITTAEGNKENWFSKKLGNRRMLSLRDYNYNNIFHLASGKNWTDEMTKVVLATRNLETMSSQNMAELLPKKEDIFRSMRLSVNISSCSKIFSYITPNFLWPERFLHLRSHLDSRNQEGDTPLIVAASNGQKDVVKALIKEKVNMNITNKKGNTALINAATKGHIEIVSELLNENVDLNIANKSGYTALHKAVANKHVEIMSLLLEQESMCESVVENGHTLFHTAAQRNFPDAIDLLLKGTTKEEYLTKKSKDKKEETALQLAVRLGDEYKDNVEHLIEHDKSWKSSKDEIIKTIYPALAGGNHKNVLTDLIGKFEQWNWADYNKALLFKAIEDNNRTAVGNIYKLVPAPSKADGKEAMVKAVESKVAFINESNTVESKKAGDIVKKLQEEVDEITTTKAVTAPAIVTGTGKEASNAFKEKRKEYLTFVKKFSGKTQNEKFEKMMEDLSRFSEFYRELETLNDTTKEN